MADHVEDWGDLADLFGPGAYEPSLAPSDPTGYDPLADDHAAWVAVDGSTNVLALVYWPPGRGPDGATLGVRFRNGGEYWYWNVSRAVYDAVLARECADHDGKPSTGASHWQLIRRRGYDYRVVVKPHTKYPRAR